MIYVHVCVLGEGVRNRQAGGCYNEFYGKLMEGGESRGLQFTIWSREYPMESFPNTRGCSLTLEGLINTSV